MGLTRFASNFSTPVADVEFDRVREAAARRHRFMDAVVRRSVARSG
jgi:hypothetical protein